MGVTSKLRWALAGTLGVVALVAAIAALGRYTQHGQTLGVGAIVALLAVLLGGFASLALARRRIERELGGLAKRPAQGELADARRARLERIRAAGAEPDRDVLAAATAADEAGRAYLGRYFVASAVLVGLVGTFAGLIETLGRLAPMLREGGPDALALLAGPLGGLHVTFGASLVAILVTLALALAQGDLTLHEDRALAALEDLTRHELIPSLWPASENAQERSVRELAALRVELRAHVADAIGEAVSRAATKMADATAAEVTRAGAVVTTQIDRVTAALDAQAQRTFKVIEDQTAAVTVRVAERVESAAAEITRAGAGVTAQIDRVTAALDAQAQRTFKVIEAQTDAVTVRVAERVESAVAQVTAALRETTSTAMSEARAGVLGATGALQEGLVPLFEGQGARLADTVQSLDRGAVAIEGASERLDALAPMLEALAQKHAAALDAASGAVLGAIDRAVGTGGATVERASGDLARAAGELRAGAERLSPQLGTVAAELAAMSREVALLAADRDDGEADRVVLSELERVGDAVERLAELVRRMRAGSGGAGGALDDDDLGDEEALG